MAQTHPEKKTQPLYAAAPTIYPKKVKGTFRSIKWALLVITLAVYYLLPFLRWDRGPDAPNQAILVDLPGRRLYFFFIDIWPQEIYYLTGLLILAAMILFLTNAVAGRVWCGYLCWQTVWTDLYMAVERLVQGDSRQRIKLDKEGFTPRYIRLKTITHLIWLLIAMFTGGAWVLYFNDAPTVIGELLHFNASFDVYLWIAILTGTTYLFAGWAREQVCIYMCPWPRIQAALTDDEALNVTYLKDRGEPRGSIKKLKALAAAGEPAGDCVDCRQCIAVCPTGVDIRKGLQLPCIQCGLCIDACNAIMTKVGKPTGLITYESEVNVERREQGLPPVKAHILRPRTLIYVAAILIVAALMGWSLMNRSFTDLSVLHDRNPIYVNLSDGSVRNGYTLRLLNKKIQKRRFRLTADGLPGLRMEIVGLKPAVSNEYILEVKPNATREIRVLLFAPAGAKLDKSTPVRFTIREIDGPEKATVSDFFKTAGN